MKRASDEPRTEASIMAVKGYKRELHTGTNKTIIY